MLYSGTDPESYITEYTLVYSVTEYTLVYSVAEYTLVYSVTPIALPCHMKVSSHVT